MVYPVSAILALLLRQRKLNPNLLTRHDRGELNKLEDLFAEEESMDMVSYMPLNRSVQTTLQQQHQQQDDPIALQRSGIPAIEAMIDDYINKYNLPHRVTRAYQALNKIIEQSSNDAELKRNLDMEEDALLALQGQIESLSVQREKGFGTDAFLTKLKNEKRGLSDKQVMILDKAQSNTYKMLKQIGQELSAHTSKLVSKNKAEYKLRQIRHNTEYAYNRMIVELDNSMQEAQKEIVADLNEQYQRYVQDLFADVNTLNLPVLDNFKNKISGLNGNMFALSSQDIENTLYEKEIGTKTISISKWWNPFSWGKTKEVPVYETVYEEEVNLAEYWHKHSTDVYQEFDGNIQSARQQMEQDANILLDNFVRFMEAEFTPRFEELVADLKEKVQDKKAREAAIAEGREQLKQIQAAKHQLNELLNV